MKKKTKKLGTLRRAQVGLGQLVTKGRHITKTEQQRTTRWQDVAGSQDRCCSCDWMLCSRLEMSLNTGNPKRKCKVFRSYIPLALEDPDTTKRHRAKMFSSMAADFEWQLLHGNSVRAPASNHQWQYVINELRCFFGHSALYLADNVVTQETRVQRAEKKTLVGTTTFVEPWVEEIIVTLSTRVKCAW